MNWRILGLLFGASVQAVEDEDQHCTGNFGDPTDATDGEGMCDPEYDLTCVDLMRAISGPNPGDPVVGICIPYDTCVTLEGDPSNQRYLPASGQWEDLEL